MLAKISWKLVLILVSAGIIAFLTFRYLDSLQETKTVVVTATDIEEKTEIEKDMLKTVKVESNAADTLAEDAIADDEKVIGAITREEIDEGVPVEMDPDKIVFPEERAQYLKEDGKIDPSKFIPKEKRLYTLALTPNQNVDNRIKKGDHVDVIYTGEYDGENKKEAFSRMIMQYVKVHDVEEIDESSLEGGNKDSLIQHITLMVAPQDAVALANVQEEGNVSLTLNPSEGEEVQVEMIYESSFER